MPDFLWCARVVVAAGVAADATRRCPREKDTRAGQIVLRLLCCIESYLGLRITYHNRLNGQFTEVHRGGTVKEVQLPVRITGLKDRCGLRQNKAKLRARGQAATGRPASGVKLFVGTGAAPVLAARATLRRSVAAAAFGVACRVCGQFLCFVRLAVSIGWNGGMREQTELLAQVVFDLPRMSVFSLRKNAGIFAPWPRRSSVGNQVPDFSSRPCDAQINQIAFARDASP